MRAQLVHTIGLALAVALAACSSPSTPPAEATPKPTSTPNRSRPIKMELNARLEKAEKVFHAGCRDDEKAACKDSTRVCVADPAKAMAKAIAKGPIVVEWEAPRETWAKNEGVLSHYWFVGTDGSGDYYYLLPSPDDVQTDCGGKYCGWHKEEIGAAVLYTDGRFHLTPNGGTEIADLSFCPPPPPQ